MCQNAIFLFDFDFNHPQCAGRTDPYPQQRSGTHPSPPTCKTKLGSPAALPESRPTLRRLQFAPRVMHAHFHIVFTVFHPLPAQSLELGGIENKHVAVPNLLSRFKAKPSRRPNLLSRFKATPSRRPIRNLLSRFQATPPSHESRRPNLLSRFKATPDVATSDSELAFKI